MFSICVGIQCIKVYSKDTIWGLKLIFTHLHHWHLQLHQLTFIDKCICNLISHMSSIPRNVIWVVCNLQTDYLNNCWMDYHENVYRPLWFPDELGNLLTFFYLQPPWCWHLWILLKYLNKKFGPDILSQLKIDCNMTDDLFICLKCWFLIKYLQNKLPLLCV